MSSGFFFDARYIRLDHHDGISRFSAGLFAQLNRLTEVTAIVSDLRQLEQLPAGTKFVKLNAPTSPLEPFVALKLNRLGAKLVFSPMQTMGSFGRKFKLALTLHDLIYYRHPAPPPAFNLAIRVLWRLYHLTYLPQRFLLNRPDLVVTVSETTKKLMQQHRLTKKPIEVIYNAADDEIIESESSGQPNNSLIYMGSFMDYKNVEVLIRGMKHLPGYRLQLLSRIKPERKDQLAELIDPNGGSVEFMNGVTDSEYHQLLTDSFALVSGSLDEGFGIPLVEAMSRAVPVVVSEIEIFKEVAGEAGQYFDPNDSQGFAQAVLALEDKAHWLEKSRLSLAQAQKFSWLHSAEKLLSGLEKI